MSGDHPPTDAPHLMWVYTESPTVALDAGTWLETTRELRKLGWRVTLIGAGPAGTHLIRGVEVLCIPMMHIYFFRQALFHLKVIYLLAREWHTLDAVLFHQMSAPWLLPLRLVRVLTGRKRPLLVMDTRDLVAASGNFKTRPLKLFYALGHRLANHWADGQTAITSRMVELVHIPQENSLGTWPSGVNIEQFARSRKKRSWPLLGESIHLVYVGRFNDERGLLQLCHAVKEANNEGTSFILSFVGEGPKASELEAFAQDSAGQIRILPRVAHENVPDLLASAHVGVTSLPPVENLKFQASSPIKLFEYMAAGLPILTTRNACHTDVVNGGSYAYLAEGVTPPQILEPLRMIWRDRYSLHVRGLEAAAAAKAWTWQATAKKLSDALDRGITRS